MDKIVFDKIWEIQDSIQNDLEYSQLLQEHKLLNAELLSQLKTMNVNAMLFWITADS